MKQKLWLALISCLAYCIDKELYNAIDYLKEQVRVLIEQQEKQNKRILLVDRNVNIGGFRSDIEVAVNQKDEINLLGMNYFEGLNYLVDSVNSCIYVWAK
jgi:predicted aspartyl protease